MTVGITVLLMLGLLATRTPVAIALLVSSAVGLILQDGVFLAADALSRVPFDTIARYTLIIIPLYLAMGVFVRYSGGAEEVFKACARLLRPLPGGLGVATIAACAAFGAVSGTSIGTIATIGQMAIREMTRYGYAKHIAAGVVGSAGTLAIMIPPSVPLVLYGIMTGESVGRLLMAGIIPGLLTALAYAIPVIIRAKMQPEMFGGGESSQPADSYKNIRKGPVLQMASIFVVIIGGIQFGFFTVSESAAVACLLALCYFIVNNRGDANFFGSVRQAIGEVVSINAMTFALLLGAGVFSYFLVSSGIPSQLTAWILSFDLPGWLVVALLLLVFVPLGMFLDGISMLLIGVPLAYPVVDALGYDGIWFGILVVKMIELGLVTPPFGMNAFIIAGMNKDISIPTAFRGVLWFVTFDVLVIILLFSFPQISTFLPSLMFSK